jgi:hypothetical protein
MSAQCDHHDARCDQCNGKADEDPRLQAGVRTDGDVPVVALRLQLSVLMTLMGLKEEVGGAAVCVRGGDRIGRRGDHGAGGPHRSGQG